MWFTLTKFGFVTAIGRRPRNQEVGEFNSAVRQVGNDSQQVVYPHTCSGTQRYYPSTALVLLWSSVPCRHWSRPLPSSPACIRGPPKDWRRRTGRPRQTWLRTVEDDLRPLIYFGLATARRRAMDRPAWRLLADAATSSLHAPERKRERARERERDRERRREMCTQPTLRREVRHPLPSPVITDLSISRLCCEMN